MCKTLIFEEIQIEDYTPIPLADEIKQQLQAEKQAEQQTELLAFYSLIEKSLKNEQITDIQLQKLCEKQRNILQALSQKLATKTKRPDECHKLFYKRAFKYSEKKYFKKKKNHKRIMSQFYHHHFDAVSTVGNIQITSFYHPNKRTKPGLAVGYRTFNLAYVRHILKSKSFRCDALEYHKIFINDCIKERNKKVKSFMNSIKKIMESEGQEALIRYLQSSQCKIPWKQDELEMARETAKKQLQKFDQFGDAAIFDPPQFAKDQILQEEDDIMDSEDQELFPNDFQLPDIL